MQLRKILFMYLIFLGILSGNNNDLYNYFSTLNNKSLPKIKNKEMFEKIFRKLYYSVYEEGKIQVNGIYKKNYINIYIIDFEDNKLNVDLNRLKYNAIALSPNIILFDYKILIELISNSISNLIMISQLLLESENLEKSKLYSFSYYFRYRNIRINRDKLNDKDKVWIKNDFQNDINKSEQIVEIINNYKMIDYFISSIAPVFFHEMGHLEENKSGQLFESINEIYENIENAYSSVVTKIWQEKIKDLEDKIDIYSIEQIKKYLAYINKYPIEFDEKNLEKIIEANVELNYKTLNEIARSMDFIPLYLSMFLKDSKPEEFEKLNILSSADYMRDLVTVDTFHNFRGMNAEDILVDVLHKKCNQSSQKAYSYSDLNNIMTSRLGFIPILTKYDWKQLKEIFFDHVKMKTHSHSFYRSKKLYDLLSTNQKFEVKNFGMNFDLGDKIFSAFFLNEASIIEPNFDNKSTHIKEKQLLDRLEDTFEFKSAINCKNLNCRVGFIKNSEEFIEVVSDKNGYIVYTRFVFPMNYVSLNDDNIDIEEFKKYNRNNLISLVLIANLKNIKNEEELLNSDLFSRYGNFRMNLLSCNVASDMIPVKDKNALIELKVIAPNKWITFEIWPYDYYNLE